jgi:hypothetical protein
MNEGPVTPRQHWHESPRMADSVHKREHRWGR